MSRGVTYLANEWVSSERVGCLAKRVGCLANDARVYLGECSVLANAAATLAHVRMISFVLSRKRYRDATSRHPSCRPATWSEGNGFTARVGGVEGAWTVGAPVTGVSAVDRQLRS